ncbi:DUF2723 domain-containing protein [bacterium]|nr:DUF2723 domain-containing protein [bacterium]
MHSSSRSFQAQVVAAGLTAFLLLVVWFMAVPSATVRDSALFSMVAWSGGIAHPPGSPTWCLLATLFVRGLGFADAAWGTNVFCGLLGALTCGGLYLLAWRVLPRVIPDIGERHRLLASLVPPLVLMQGPGWWMQCLATEQYTLMTAFLVLLGHLALSARDSTRVGWWMAIGLVWGLAVGNHLSQICLVIPIILVGWRDGENPLRWLKRMVLVGCGFAAGISVYAWVLLRSPADPLIDSGDVSNFKDLLWLIGRDQFTRRALSEAPAGFTMSWIESYALPREIGAAGIVLALLGIVVAARKSWRLLLVIAAFVVPYAVGILYGHLRQAGFGVSYAENYGVVDWHVAIYLCLALLAGFGAAALGQHLYARRGSPALRGWHIALALVLLVGASASALSESRFASTDMSRYSAAILDPLPEGAVVNVGTDNVAFIIAYDWWLRKHRPDLHMAWGAPAFGSNIAKASERWTSDPRSMRLEYLNEVVRNKRRNPLRAPLPSGDDFTSGPLCVDFTPDAAAAAKYLIPRGFLFEVSNTLVTNEAALAADAEWREAAKLPAPDLNVIFQERRAWSEIFERRALYYFARNQMEQACEEYAVAVAWFPEQARLWYRFGEANERLGRGDVAEEMYRRAIATSRYEPGPHRMLAGILAQRGELAEAVSLLEKEQVLDPALAPELARHIEAMKKILRGE